MHLVIFEEPNISLVIFSLKYPKAISLVGAINETLIDAIYHMRGNHLILVAYIFGESKRGPGIMLADWFERTRHIIIIIINKAIQCYDYLLWFKKVLKDWPHAMHPNIHSIIFSNRGKVDNAMDCLEFSFWSFYVFHYLYEILEWNLPLPLEIDLLKCGSNLRLA